LLNPRRRRADGELTRVPGIEHSRRTPVALQGTIDAFPLTDVLQLLSSASKSGRLLLQGDRGHAELWIEQGSVVGGDAGAATSGAAQLVFELLRFSDGSFVFDVADGTPATMVEPAALDECVSAAAELLEEWVRIETVVPSMQHGIAIAAELSGDSVSLTADEWRIVAAAGDAPSVGELATRLGLDEFGAGAALAQLVERSLLVVHEPRAVRPLWSSDDPSPMSAVTTEVDVFEPSSEPPVIADTADEVEEDTFPERFPIDDLLGGGTDDTGGPWAAEEDDAHRFAAAQTFEPLGTDGFDEAGYGEAGEGLPDRTAEAWDEVVAGQTSATEEPWHEPAVDPAEQQAADDTADEVLRQMSRLSPKAAEAIAAALNGPNPTSPVSHEVVAAQSENDGPVSFMGSF
jgi:hypothetical protein